MIILKYKRKPSIIQFQIPDFIYGIKKQIYTMSISKELYHGKKALEIRKPAKKPGRKPHFNPKKYKQITGYLIQTKNTYKSAPYLLRFPQHTPNIINLNDNPLKPYEILLYQSVGNFHGYFDDLFFLNDLSYFDYVDELMGRQNIRLGVPLLHDILIYEFARIQSGNETYAQFIRNFAFFGPQNFKHLLYCPEFIPSVQDFSRMFHAVPFSYFREFFGILRYELEKLKLLRYRILIWDCQFVHSNASDYKNRITTQYSDPDAGLGRHNNKFLGVGYMVSTIYAYCGKIVLPVWCQLFPANLNDRTIFKQSFEQYFCEELPIPELVLADAGPYSLENLELLALKDIIPLVNAPKNVKTQNVVQFKKNLYLNKDFIPTFWSDKDIKRIFSIRTTIERLFSHNIQMYNARRMNTRGIEQASIHRYLLLILDLLKALTCYKIGRSDLFQTFTSFCQMKEGVDAQMVQFMFKNRGYKILDNFILKEDPDEIWDDFRKNIRNHLRK